MKVLTRNIPNALTCINIIAGFCAVICGSRGSAHLWGMVAWQWACIFIGIAAVADFLDGFSARMLHAYSALGKELDSLCDLVSFGVAPGVLVFFALDNPVTEPWLPWCTVLIPLCGAIRLARFNVDSTQSTSFIGLPIPANAIFWIGFAASYYELPVMSTWLVVLWIVVIALMMVSPLKMFSLKFKTYGLKENYPRYIVIAAAAVLTTIFGLPGLMYLIVFYIIFSLLLRVK